MLELFSFLFNTFPLIVSWFYLLVAMFCVVVHIKHIKNKVKISFGRWVFFVLNAGYVLSFFVMWIFFKSSWEQSFAVFGLLFGFIAIAWSRYEDRCAGRRWWNW